MTDAPALRPIRIAADGETIEIIDQTRLPHVLVWTRLATMDDARTAIADMLVRGAPLIGATAAYGVALAMRADPSDSALDAALAALESARPTAVNLRWALEDMNARLRPTSEADRAAAAFARAGTICEEDAETNGAIGDHGLALLEAIAAKKEGPLNVLTHCNAGWLACVAWGTATAPIYKAHAAGLDVHVWVDETRPRNQGASLTAWELGRAGVPHTVVADNAGGHLMRRGLVDVCIVGTDRTTATGDVCNKIGTYLKALAAYDNAVPFYVALPSPTIDWRVDDGDAIPIEERDAREVTHIAGATADGRVETVRLTPAESPAANPAFDVTPARLVTGLITERGVCAASADGLRGLFPEARAA